jgi:hypothetical protein
LSLARPHSTSATVCSASSWRVTAWFARRCRRTFKKRYGNFINGEWVAPVKGQYFENITPVTGRPFCEIPLDRGRRRACARCGARHEDGLGQDFDDSARANILCRIAADTMAVVCKQLHQSRIDEELLFPDIAGAGGRDLQVPL